MPRIFDNIEQKLLPALAETLAQSDRADFSVGYFNLRGWKDIAPCIDRWTGGPDHCCRLLVGMQRLPADDLARAWRLDGDKDRIDNQTALQMKRRMAAEFRDQLMVGFPSNADLTGLRQLANQIRARKVVVKLFLRHQLHAKLYLLYLPNPLMPILGYLGSSNLTMAGLRGQGELNVDVKDDDAGAKLARWFEDRWDDPWCIDISDELAEIIDASWAGERLIEPYQIYVKMAYHLSEDARAGLSEFKLPRDMEPLLFDFQKAAVKIAAHHLYRRGGVLLGDVVGLGKTMMATAVARIFEDDHDLETLIICPKSLVPMWTDYRERFRMRARVLSLSSVEGKLPGLRRYRMVLIDESHHLRNRDGRRYRIIQDYIRANDSRVILLSATPYNKSFLDLANQLRLFVPEDADVGIRPERLLREEGEVGFVAKHQCGVRTLAAFEKSSFTDDWRELMRLYLVRRTRSFIQTNYAAVDQDGRRYLTFADGSRAYFPTRVPRTLGFTVDADDPDDAYARMFSDPVVDAIARLALPRYGLGNYVRSDLREQPTAAERQICADLSRGGKRLMGFCRTNLFKRLESSGHAFLQSVERHVVRNFVFLHALENGLDVPIGTQDVGLLDVRVNDADSDWLFAEGVGDVEIGDDEVDDGSDGARAIRHRAQKLYEAYQGAYRRRFRWLPMRFFLPELAEDLRHDADQLLAVLARSGPWDPRHDAKLGRLVELLTQVHPGEKVLVFSQFADTVTYLAALLPTLGCGRVAGATGAAADPTGLAWRFSPVSNDRRLTIPAEREIDVLIATDVLSEGQNLQDARIVVNFDLPWAIIRLIQRAGRVDRIGQQASEILCYSFLPADGVDRILRLRERVRQRLRENQEVVGTDEAFFDDDCNDQVVRDLFTETAGVLDGEEDADVDLGSQALEVWRGAVKRNPSLERTIPDLANVVFATKSHRRTDDQPEGALVYVRTASDYDALAWIGPDGQSVTESQFTILRAAACEPSTPALPPREDHHDLVRAGVERVIAEEQAGGGQLGKPSGARFRTYERLKHYAEGIAGTLFDRPELHRAIEDVFRFPLQQAATDTLNRMLRAGVTDDELARRVIELRDEDRLSVAQVEGSEKGPRIICSLGLAITGEGR